MRPEEIKYIVEHGKSKSPQEIAKDLGLRERKVKRFLDKNPGPKINDDPSQAVTTKTPLNIPAVLLSFFFILALGFGVYANSLHNQFIWDDSLYIHDNYFIREARNIPSLFTKNVTYISDNNFYRPLQMATYTLNYIFNKFDVRAYHLTNTSIHMMVAMSIFWLGLLLSRSVFLAMAAGVLFVSHPIHTEAVTYISGRADPMVTLFVLLTVIAYVYYTRKKNILLLLASIAAFILALLSKENAVIAPLLILAYEYIFNERKVVFLRLLPFVAVDLIYIILRQTVLKFQTADFIAQHTSLSNRLPLIFYSLTMYFKKLFLPLDLHMDYPLYRPSLISPGVLLGVIICFLLLLLIFKAKEKIVSFAAAWFLIMYVPISNIFPLNAFFYEHWVYTPSIGLFIIAGWAFLKLCKINKAVMFLSLLILGAALSSNVCLSLRQNLYWGDPEVFFKRILKYNPSSVRAYNELALMYLSKGKTDESIQYAQKAIEIDPQFYIPHVNLVSSYINKGMYDKALEEGQKAVALKPDSSSARFNLGSAYLKKSMYGQALREFNKAIEITPIFFEAYNSRGVVYFKEGKYDQSILDYNKAIKLNPNYLDAYNNLGVTYDQQGLLPRAILEFNKALEISPKNDNTYVDRGKSYYKMHQFDQAISNFNQAITINPMNASAYSLLGLSYNEEKKFDQAIAAYSQGIKLYPKDSENFYNRAISYGQKGSYEQAVANYTQAIAIDPKYADAYNNRGADYAFLHDYDHSIADFTRVIEINPQDAAAYHNRGTIYSIKAQYDQAIQDFKKAIGIDPKYALAYYKLAVIYFSKNDKVNAWGFLHKAESLGFKPDPDFVDKLKKS